ncbi:sulfite exporter TauE/SafE family protein [Aquimarina pacifica]|uniref:sulfite exporter TauE/SafE family protein n=1 Tax=Aquimarina pacifica TaxID=1296415 RepID=UPI00046E73E5|nr:sulfite exporter TauE/SafE family protein [Aquimarina pacifica]
MLLSGFILGILGSFHCIGMCGPIAFLLPLDKTNQTTKFFQILLYHSGRLFAYGLIGLFFGLIGKSLNLLGIQQALSIGIGVTMILLVVLPHKTITKYNFVTPITRLVSKVKSSLGQALNKKTPDTFLIIGFLNGFLPCGLVYMAVLGAIVTEALLMSSFYMVFFGLGTLPLMTTVVYIGDFLTQKTRQSIQRIIPICIVLIGLLFIIRGLGLGIPYISPKPTTEIVSANFECR